MSGVKLVVKHAFGVNTHIRNGLIFCEDHHIAYVCGHQVVIFNTESKEQSFVGPTALPGFQSQGITAIACAYRRNLVAIAERADPVAVVSFYDTHAGRKRKVLNYPDLGSKEIRSMAFSDDCRFCLTLGAGPEWNLVLWAVEKSAKVVSTAKVSTSDETPFHQVSYCPWDPTLVLAIGKSAIKVFRISDGQLRPVTLSFRRESSNFISHCWLEEDEKLVIGTEAGEILLLENLEFRAIVYPSGNEAPEEIRPILGIVATSRGFAIGTTSGELRFFERNPNMKDHFQMEDSFQIPAASAGPAGSASRPGGLCITGLALGSDDSIICSTNTQQLLTFSMSQLKAIKDGVASAGTGVEFLMTSFHSPNERGEAAITGIDVAMWKPLVVTCGLDRTVRLWNTHDRRLELMRELDDEPVCLSVHPSGMYVTVGFASKISLFSVLIDSLELTGTIVCRNCTVLKYSTGGQFLASGNGSNIQVYNPFSGSLICCLRGHANKVCNFVWQNLDSRLMSVGMDGAVFFWDLFPAKCRSEHYNGKIGSIFISGTGFKDGSRAFVTTPEKVVKEIVFNRSTDAAAVETVIVTEAEDLDFGITFGHVHMDESRKLLLMCSADPAYPGSMLCVLASPQLGSLYDVQTVHGGPITAICQSYDGMLIFTGDVNGCLCISEFDTEPGGAKSVLKARDSGAAFEFEDEVLVHKADIEQKKAEIREMSVLVGELSLSNEHQLRMKEIGHLEVTKKTTDLYSAQLETDNALFQETMSNKRQMEAAFQSRMASLSERNAEELLAISNKSRAKVSTEENRHAVLVRDTEETNKRWDEENRALVASHQAYLREMTSVYEDKLKVEQSKQRQTQREKEQLQIEYNLSHINTELDADIEIATMKIKQEAKLKSEEDMGVDLMAQHALLRKNLHLLQKDVDQQKDDIRKLREKEGRLTDTMKNLEKDIHGHKKEIREREETISDKEKRIFDLKKKNQELEKFRFVLDYKIKELKLQIAPRESEISSMRAQGEEMNLELEQYHKSHLALNLMIEELKLKLEGLRRELLDQKDREAMDERVHGKIKRDLQEIWGVRDSPVQLKELFLRIYRVYVQEDVGTEGGLKRAGASGEDPQITYNRDREMLERSLEGLRRALKTDSLSNKREVTKMMRERSQLIKELNALRKDAGDLRLQNKTIERAGLIGPKMDVAVLNDTLALLGINISRREAAVNNAGGHKDIRSTRRNGAGLTSSFQFTQGSNSLGKSKGVLTMSEKLDYMDRSDRYGERDDGGGGGGDSRVGKLGGSVHRTIALRTTSAGGRVESIVTGERYVNVSSSGVGAATSNLKDRKSKNDQYEALREVQMQVKQMAQSEEQLRGLCAELKIDADHLLRGINANLSLCIS